MTSARARPASHAATGHLDGDDVPLLDAHVRRHVVDAHLLLPAGSAPVTALFGPSGAGKTTVLRVLAGLERTSGHVRVRGATWDDGRSALQPRHRHVGYLFQDAALFPHLDVDANVAYGLTALPRAGRPARVAEALAAAGAEHLAGRRVTELSGGEAQRVALARALAPRPSLLLLDEPLSALDTPTRTRLRTELRRILLEQQIPTIVVTHDRAEALALADQVAVLIDGRIHQIGSPQQVFERPGDDAVAAVVGVETAVPGVVQHTDDGLIAVRVADRTLQAISESHLAAGTDVLVCIRAEDVALQLPAAEQPGSPRNRLLGLVRALLDEGPLVRVELDCGFILFAYITRQAASDLALTHGQQVVAVVKSPAVHLIARPA
jgi:molybdate transport system ATP-binding protein